MGNNAKHDLIAVVLIAFIISVVSVTVWMNQTTNDSSHLTQLSEASEQLITYVNNYNWLTPEELTTAKLDPHLFIEAAAYAPDNGTANELQYIAGLITQYNKGANIEVLQQAVSILNEVMIHVRETLCMYKKYCNT